MSLGQLRLHRILGIACVTAYIWLLYSYQMLQSGQINSVELCIFKRITGLPCPSCGSTRSVLFILQGNFDEAFSINPLGFAIIALMTILPIWLIADIVGKKKTLQYTYGKAERILSKPIVAIPCLMLLGAHWIWAIFNHI